MSENRKIVIQLSLPQKPDTPDFESEETLSSARRVVPLKDGAPLRKAFWPIRWAIRTSPIAGLIIVAGSIALGLVAGLTIAHYRYAETASLPEESRPIEVPSLGIDSATEPPDSRRPAEVIKASTAAEEKTDTVEVDSTQVSTPQAEPERSVEPPPSEKPTADKPTVKDIPQSPTARTEVTRQQERPAPRQAPEHDTRPRPERSPDQSERPREVERENRGLHRIREIFEGQP